jgi:hypothetical protein
MRDLRNIWDGQPDDGFSSKLSHIKGYDILKNALNSVGANLSQDVEHSHVGPFDNGPQIHVQLQILAPPHHRTRTGKERDTLKRSDCEYRV